MKGTLQDLSLHDAGRHITKALPFISAEVLHSFSASQKVSKILHQKNGLDKMDLRSPLAKTELNEDGVRDSGVKHR